MKLRNPVRLTRRKFSLSEQVLVEDIVRAWLEPGINPQYHERRKDVVRAQMPTLGRKLDVLAERLTR